MPSPTSTPCLNWTRRRARSPSPCSSIPAGGFTSNASTSPAIPRPATRWCAGKSGRWKGRGTTRRRSTVRANASIVWAISTRSTSRRRACPEPPTRSTSTSASTRSPPAASWSARAILRPRAWCCPARFRRPTCSAPATASPRKSTPAASTPSTRCPTPIPISPSTA